MTETRFKENATGVYEIERAERMLSFLSGIRVRKRNAAQVFLEDRELAKKIRDALSERDSISFILPAFPFKSRNIERKCIGELPDKAEEIAVRNLDNLGAKLSSVANTKIIVALDGFAYSDIVGVPSEAVIAYTSAIKAMLPEPKVIEWLGAHETKSDGERFSRLLDECYAPSVEEIRSLIQSDPSAAQQYVGLKSFWKRDIHHSGNAFGSKERDRRAGDIAVRMMARNAAYSRYLSQNFPEAIRLSIHASHGRKGRFHINLLPDTEDTSGGSPWHGAALKTSGGGWKVIRREQAEQEGHMLVYENGRPSYFAERKPHQEPRDA
jgi:pyoverdine/dityrosine biosynthesis protein Dit1